MDPLHQGSSTNLPEGAPPVPTTSIDTIPAASATNDLMAQFLLMAQGALTIEEEGTEGILTKQTATQEAGQAVGLEQHGTSTEGSGQISVATGLEEAMQLQHAIKNVVVIHEIVPTAVPGEAVQVKAKSAEHMGAKELEQAGHRKMFAHGNELCVFPNSGLAHGQKVVLDINGEKREFTVRHFTDDEVQAFSKMVGTYIAQLPQSENSVETEKGVQEKKEGHTTPLQKRSIALIQKRHVEKGDERPRASGESRAERTESQNIAELTNISVEGARDRARALHRMDYLINRAIMFLNRDYKEYFNMSFDRLLNGHKQINILRQNHRS